MGSVPWKGWKCPPVCARLCGITGRGLGQEPMGGSTWEQSTAGLILVLIKNGKKPNHSPQTLPFQLTQDNQIPHRYGMAQ